VLAPTILRNWQPSKIKPARRFRYAAPATRPFSIHRPELEELSSPQLDMLFDVMSFLYRGIPAMELIEHVRAQALAEVERASDQTAAGMNGPRPAQLARPFR
jgi:hypothetical protein